MDRQDRTFLIHSVYILKRQNNILVYKIKYTKASVYNYDKDNINISGNSKLQKKLNLSNISLALKAAFAVVPTDEICGRSLSSNTPVDMNSIFMKLYVT